MSNSLISPLQTFTLESLVTNGQWNAAQNNGRKKNTQKLADPKKTTPASALEIKKPAL